MLRNGRWKYNYYPGYDPELFDMEMDSEELHNLANNPDYQEIIDLCHEQMLTLVDPEEANALAFRDQAEKIEQLGGVQAILDSEEFDFTPIPTDKD